MYSTRVDYRTHTTTDALTWRKASQGGEGGCPGGWWLGTSAELPSHHPTITPLFTLFNI